MTAKKAKPRQSPSSKKNNNYFPEQLKPLNRTILILFLAVFCLTGGYALYRYTFAATSGYGAIKSGLAGKCLDNFRDSATSGSKVDIWTCNGSAAQHWKQSGNLVVTSTGLCLDNYRGSSVNGNPIIVFRCSSSDAAEQWVFQANHTLRNPATGKCLDDPAWSTVNGTQLKLYTCNGGANQKWTFSPLATPTAAATPTPTPSTNPSPSPSSSPVAVAGCTQIVLPAYWYPDGNWTTATNSHPAFLILDISGSGAGSAPDPTFQAYVKRAQAAGVKVLGYDDTTYAARAVNTVESEIQHYKSWYNVTDVFFDQVSSDTGHLNYYQTLYSYAHSFNPGSTVMLNPGTYPAEQYMNVGDILMVDENSYANYLQDQTPSWVYNYNTSRFVHTIHDTPTAAWTNALKLAQERHAGYVFITDRGGANPYNGLPSYWSSEVSTTKSSCQ